MNSTKIIKSLPYKKPFLFVDELIEISEKGVKGKYTYREDEFFYEGHFKNNPITPGVILTETMAQIGLVCLGVFLLEDQISSEEKKPQIALTSNEVDFFLPVLPNEKVTVISEKEYFRFNKLKCKVKMLNANDELVCRGTISGMIIAK
ncbi:hydroxymyristoyl-ACP dehydratase [Polaribacter sp. BM10]|uniref:3-hydroxyacyl-ACP dehydratase FabZ family protein n=1 Tax=Polaribacter sp. BM10 TaxID=1529069 RepID=UPI00098B9065|nr:3-hydroxyacyl-ACP dehydratase FabZ family protein [Polaribacter sp. BM10]AQS94568.1 hydroxymyristoyl-ACP dehydratase [Polaribacter sp. BM10]